MSDDLRDETVRRFVEALIDGQSGIPKHPDPPLDASDREAVRKLQLIARIAETLGNTPADDHGSLEPPFEWGPLEVLERIGCGAYGDVYRARDTRLDRTVALKLLREPFPEQKSDSAIIDEARLLARLRHPNVVAVYGADRIRGRTGIWMEFLEGRTLEAELAARGPLPVDEVVAIGVEICRAVEAAHKSGVLHRDLKPQNVMRGADGQIRLTDFGTGRETADGTNAHQLVGTPRYLAPEVLDGHAASERSDIYSLGVLLYRLATGSYPNDPSSLAYAAALPNSVRSVITTATSTSPASRYATASDMGSALVAAAETSAHSERRWNRFLTPALALLVCVTGAAWMLSHRRGAAPPIRPLVLVAAVENRTNDANLDETLQFLLERELTNSGFVRVAGRPRIDETLALMRKPPDAPLDLALSLELARRDGGIPAVLTSSIDKLDNRITFSSRLMQSADGTVQASFSGEVEGTAALPMLVRKQAAAIRSALGEASRSIARVERVTTPSFRAAQLYTRAVSQMSGDHKWNNPAAEQLLLDAIHEDPIFASAHLLAAWAIFNQGRDVRDYMPHAENALRSASGVSEAERHFISGSVHHLRAVAAADQAARRSALTQALGAYEAALEEQPEHLWALNNIQNVLQMLDEPLEELRIVRRMADIRPNSFGLNSRALSLALLTGDLSLAERYGAVAAASVATARYPEESAMIRLLPATLAWLHDDAASAMREADAVASTLHTFGRDDQLAIAEQLSYVYLTLGAARRAEAIAAALPEDESYTARRLQAAALWLRGDDVALRQLLRALRRNPAAAWRLTGLFIDLGLLAEAHDLVRFQRQHQTDHSYMQECAARLRLAESPVTNIESVRSLAEGLRVKPSVAFLPRHMEGAIQIAGLLDNGGYGSEAIELLEALSARRTSAAAFGAGARWLQVRVALADLYDRAGRARDAWTVRQQLLRLLSAADADLPLVARLQAQAQPARH